MIAASELPQFSSVNEQSQVMICHWESFGIEEMEVVPEIRPFFLSLTLSSLQKDMQNSVVLFRHKEIIRYSDFGSGL